MTYDVGKPTASRCLYPKKGKNQANFSSKGPQKTRLRRFFRHFSPYLAHKLASKKNSIPTHLEGTLWPNG